MIHALLPLLLASAAADTPADKCPVFEIITSEEPGLLEFFATKVPDDTPTDWDEVTYNWTVSAGSIDSGQGTDDIYVRAVLGDIVTASVEVGGLPPNCPTTFSGTEEAMIPTGDE